MSHTDTDTAPLVTIARQHPRLPDDVYEVHAHGADSAEVYWPTEGPVLPDADGIGHVTCVTPDVDVYDGIDVDVWVIGIYPDGAWFDGGMDDAFTVPLAAHEITAEQVADLVADLAPANTPEGCCWSDWAAQRLADHPAHLAI